MGGIAPEQLSIAAPPQPEAPPVAEPIDNQDPEASYQEAFPNLAKLLSDKMLEKIGRDVVAGYKADEMSRAEWLENYKTCLRLFHMKPKSKKKDTPWPNASNLVVPVITTASIQFWARASDAILGSKNIVKVLPLSGEEADYEKADRVQKHMEWQIRYGMEDFEDGMNGSLMQLPISGTVIRKTYYDPVENQNVSTFIKPEDFVINYWATSIDKSFRHTHILRENINDMRVKEADGFYINVKGLSHGTIAINETTNLKISNEADSETQPVSADENTPRVALEQHTYLAIFNDNGRPTGQKASKTAIKKQYVVTVDLESEKVLSIIDNKNPNTGKKMKHFTKYSFLKNPDGGFYDIGFGILLKMSNEAQNTLLNQLVDAGLLSNTQCGFKKKRRGMKSGAISFKQGQFVEVDLQGSDDIRKSIMPMQFPGPQPVLFQLLNFLQDHANRLTTVTDAFTGEMPRSDTTATGVVTLLEQGLKVFKAVYRGIHKSFSKELIVLYDLNGVYLDDNQYFNIVTNMDEVRKRNVPVEVLKGEIGRDDYQAKLDVIPMSDPNIISKAEDAKKAQFVYQTVIANPLTQNNPSSMYAALEQYLESVEYDPSKVDAVLLPILAQIQTAQERQRQEGIALQGTAELLEAGQIPPEMIQNALITLMQMKEAEGQGDIPNEQG